MAKQKTTLFNALYSGLKSTISLMKQPLIERAVSRKFDGFIDGCLQRIDDSQLELNKLREAGIKNPESMNLNAICKAILDIKQAEELMEVAKEEKRKLFEEEVDVVTPANE